MKPENSVSEAKQTQRFSSILHAIRLRLQSENTKGLTLREVIELFGPKGHALLTLFLVLPFLQPIPLPGISTAMGLVIAMVGLFMFLDRPPWVPDRLARVHLDSQFLIRVCSGAEGIMRKLERLVKPRGQFYFSKNWYRKTAGLMIGFHALLLSLPLPIPLSNFFPAIVLVLLALGTLEEDLYIVMASYLATIVNLAYFSTLILLPYLSVKMLNN